jgi:hypothetical protein
MLAALKATVRDGYELPFAAALELERERGRAHNAKVEAAAIESRREAVRQRNRKG